MAQVTFIHKNGTKRRMPERDAKILAKLKKGTYQSDPAPQIHPKMEMAEGGNSTGQAQLSEQVLLVENGDSKFNNDGLEQMDREALLKYADELGLKVHGRSGDEKIRETIRGHLK